MTGMDEKGLDFKYPSYVQDILGPFCFDYGFGPFRWVCASGKTSDLDATDRIAKEVMEEMLKGAPEETKLQLMEQSAIGKKPQGGTEGVS